MKSLHFLFCLLTFTLSLVDAGRIARSYAQHDFYLSATLNSNWQPVETFYPPAFFKDYNHLVRLRGVAALVSGNLPSVLFTLPEEMRPLQTLKLRVATFKGSEYAVGILNITKAGEVVAVDGSTIISLDSIVFSVPNRKSVLVQGNNVSVNFRFPKPQSVCLRYWEQLWSPRDPTIRACHETDLDDEVLLTGAVAPAQSDSASGMVGILDRPQRPNRDIRVCAPSTRGPVQLHIRASGDMFVRGYKGGSVYLDGVSYVVNQVNNWREIPQWKNGFSEAVAEWFVIEKRFTDMYTTPGFRKDSEGRIFLKGIVAPPRPFVQDVVFVLPEGYRPSETIHRCGATRRGFVTISINIKGEVSVENLLGSDHIEWLSLDGVNFLGAETKGEVLASHLKFYDVDTLFTSVEGSYLYGENITLTRPPLKNSAYFGFVEDTPVIATATHTGKVKVEEFPRVDSDNVMIGSEWNAIFFIPKPDSVVFEANSERPAFMVDRNNNILVLRGLFPYEAHTVKLFQLPKWIQIENDILLVATGHKSHYPLIVRTTGEVEWVGPQPASDTLILLDGLHFPVVAGSEPPMKHIIA